MPLLLGSFSPRSISTKRFASVRHACTRILRSRYRGIITTTRSGVSGAPRTSKTGSRRVRVLMPHYARGDAGKRAAYYTFICRRSSTRAARSTHARAPRPSICEKAEHLLMRNVHARVGALRCQNNDAYVVCARAKRVKTPGLR